MQFIPFPPRKIGQKIETQDSGAIGKSADADTSQSVSEASATAPEVFRNGTQDGKCRECGKPAVLHTNGTCSWCTPVETLSAESKPLLAENPAEAQRMAVGGRRLVALKASRTFDTERLSESLLFKRSLF